MSAVVTISSTDRSLTRRSATLRVAVALSVLVHAMIGITASRMGVISADDGTVRLAAGHVARWSPPINVEWAPPPAPEPESAPRRPQEPPVVVQPPELEEPLRLGIEKSRQATENVIGFDDPTPHSAMKSAVDQPALDPAAGASEAGGSPSSGAPASESAAAAPDDAVVGPPAPPEEVLLARARGEAERAREAALARAKGVENPDEGDGPGPSEGFAEPMEAQAEQRAGAPNEDPAEGDDDRSRPMKPETAPAPQPSTPKSISPTPAMPASAPQRPGDAGSVSPVLGSGAGERSEKEADAASKSETIEVTLGRPAAGQGLEIITKRPRRNPFSLLTRVTELPTNPVIEVKFDRTGKVIEATIVKSSGAKDIDGPVLAAVYGWTARGERLAKLPPLEPGKSAAVVTVNVTILLR